MSGNHKWEAVIRRPSGIATIYTPRRFYIFMCRITISHFSFQISHSSESSKRTQGTTRPMGAPPRALYFFEKMRYTIKHHLWRCSQALRRGACKPLIPVFNSGHRLQPSHSCTCRSFFLQNGLACDSESIGIRIAIVAVALPFSNETHRLSDRIPRLLLLPAAMMCILVDSLRLEDHQHDRTGNNECTAQP